jgi:glycosyltransferase involved in cell wall biosynthesis
MKIAIDARPFSYELTGIGVYLKHLLDEIQKIDSKNDYYLISNGPIDYDLKNPRWSKIEGKLKKKLLSTLWVQSRMPLIVSKLNVDLFWGPRHHLPMFLPPRTRTVLTIHDLVHRLHPDTMALPNLLVERTLMKRSLIRSDSIIAVSQSTAVDIQRNYGVNSNKINVIYHGTPALPRRPNGDVHPCRDLPPKYFLFVGTLDPRKNFERLFRAFQLLEPLSRGVHLVIVGGKGWKNTRFLQMLTMHPVKTCVHLTGYVPRSQLWSIYENAVCLLFPSLFEGFGLPILEAMACGTAVITSNTSSMTEVAGDAALSVNPYDVGALADAMQEILMNQSLREHLVTKGFQRIKMFSWERCAEQTLGIFNRFANGSVI